MEEQKEKKNIVQNNCFKNKKN